MLDLVMTLARIKIGSAIRKELHCLLNMKRISTKGLKSKSMPASVSTSAPAVRQKPGGRLAAPTSRRTGAGVRASSCGWRQGYSCPTAAPAWRWRGTGLLLRAVEASDCVFFAMGNEVQHMLHWRRFAKKKLFT